MSAAGSAAEPGPGKARERRSPGDRAEPVRSGLQGLVFVVTELDLGGGNIAFQLLDTGSAGDRHDGRAVDDPGERDLRRVAECASATSRSTAIRSPARSRLSGRNSGLATLTRFAGRLPR